MKRNEALIIAHEIFQAREQQVLFRQRWGANMDYTVCVDEDEFEKCDADLNALLTEHNIDGYEEIGSRYHRDHYGRYLILAGEDN